jgi:COP9 signalosome complex subunit 2
MLSGSDINPFDSQETKPYQNDPRISTMTDLVNAYQREDIHEYEKILQNNKDLLQDPFIAENIDEVTRNVRTKAVINLVAPYTRFTLAFISKQLKISLSEVQEIVRFLIVDGRLRGKINQRDGTVEVESSTDMDRVQAMRDWSAAIASLWTTVLDSGDGFRLDETGPQFSPHPPMRVGGGGGGVGDFGETQRSGWSMGGLAGKGAKGGKLKGFSGRLPGIGNKA